MAISDAQKKSNAKYKSARRKQLVLNYSSDDYEAIRMHCQKLGIPMATWCKLLIEKAMRESP